MLEDAIETEETSVPPILTTFASGLLFANVGSYSKVILSPTLKSLPPSKILISVTVPELTFLILEIKSVLSDGLNKYSYFPYGDEILYG